MPFSPFLGFFFITFGNCSCLFLIQTMPKLVFANSFDLLAVLTLARLNCRFQYVNELLALFVVPGRVELPTSTLSV